MKNDKYDRQINLLCPACGNTQMEYLEYYEDVKCICCGRLTTHDQLIEENGESIDLAINDIKKEVSKDMQKRLDKILKNAFKGSKNIRIK